MATKNERITPFIATHPGRILDLELKERNISQKSFAEMIEMSKSHFNEIIKGTRNITPTIANKIEDVLGISAASLVNLQAQYDCALARIQDRSREEQAASNEILSYNSIFDVKTFFNKVGLKVVSSVEQLRYLIEEARLPSPSLLAQESAGMFRKSAATGKDARMLMTWKILAETSARSISIENSFSTSCKDELLSELRAALHKNNETEKTVTDILNKFGIVFCVVEKVAKASVDGYSFVENGVPYIVLTKRFDRIDNFAFSLLHEVGHIFLHHTKEGYMNTHLSIEDYDNESQEEKEANSFAADALIPPAIWSSIPEVRLNPYAIQYTYSKWAAEKNLNKWIVLGRIANETGMYRFRADNSRKIS